MKFSFIYNPVVILLIITTLAVTIFFSLISCEETLEVCPSCGDIEAGEDEIVGDPRIDLTFTSVQELRRITHTMYENANAAALTLATVFEVPGENGLVDMETLSTAVTKYFTENDNVSNFDASILFGGCSVDQALAVKIQNLCEDRLCNIDRPSDNGLCRGLTIGNCTQNEEGRCFSPINNVCDGLCIGTCRDMDSGVCNGNCMGSCDGNCLSYAQDGSCIGPCNGRCTGICDTQYPVECNGICSGSCSLSENPSACNDGDTFYGQCADLTAENRCRGQFYPEGCGEQCSGCLLTSSDCREVSKFAAWMHLRCTPSFIQVGGQTATSSTEAAAIFLERTKTMEKTLTPIADDYVLLSLLLEGLDMSSGEHLQAFFISDKGSTLDDAADQYYDYKDLSQDEIPPIDLNRSYLPIESLKSRIYWLNRVSMNSSGGFRISAGTYDCLNPALEESASILSALVPVTRIENVDYVTYAAYTSCPHTTHTPLGEVPCLYYLNKMQADLLRLLQNEISK